MKCWHCKHELRWNCDYDFEDYYALDGNGIVTSLSCDNCGAEVLITLENKEIENDTSKQTKSK